METAPAAPQRRGGLGLLAALTVVIVLFAAFSVYEYSLASSLKTSDSQLGQSTSSLQGVVSSQSAALSASAAAVQSLDQNVSAQAAARAELASSASSLSTQVASLQSIVSLQIRDVLVNGQTFNTVANASTSVIGFTAQYAGYLQITGSNTTTVVLGVCYGATSQGACDTSINYFLVVVGPTIPQVPITPGPIWINAYASEPGSTTLTITEVT